MLGFFSTETLCLLVYTTNKWFNCQKFIKISPNCRTIYEFVTFSRSEIINAITENAKQ